MDGQCPHDVSVGVRRLFEDGILASLEGGYALDAGCGEGHDTLFLADQGLIVDAVDNRNMSLRSRITGLPVTFHTAAIQHFTIMPDYSLIIASHLFPYIEDKEVVEHTVRAMAAALVEGGFFYFTLFGREDVNAVNPRVSFFGQSEALALARQPPLKLYYFSVEEGYMRESGAELKYRHVYRFICTRP